MRSFPDSPQLSSVSFPSSPPVSSSRGNPTLPPSVTVVIIVLQLPSPRTRGARREWRASGVSHVPGEARGADVESVAEPATGDWENLRQHQSRLCQAAKRRTLNKAQSRTFAALASVIGRADSEMQSRRRLVRGVKVNATEGASWDGRRETRNTVPLLRPPMCVRSKSARAAAASASNMSHALLNAPNSTWTRSIWLCGVGADGRERVAKAGWSCRQSSVVLCRVIEPLVRVGQSVRTDP
jgi:hypothetical protein